MMTRTAGASALLLATTALLAACTAGGATPTTPSASASTSPAAPACIVGDWRADAAQVQAAYDLIPPDLDYPDATIDPDASIAVTFRAEGTFTYTPHVPMRVTWLGRTAAAELGGTLTGTYTTDGDALRLAAESNELTVTPRDDAPSSITFAAATQETLTEWPVAARSFSCDATGLVLDLDTEGHVASVAFTRG